MGLGYRGKGIYVKLCERNYCTECDTSESESDVQQGERVAGEGTTIVPGSVKGPSATGRTRAEETDAHLDGRAPVRMVTCSPANDVTTPGRAPARVTTLPPSELRTV